MVWYSASCCVWVTSTLFLLFLTFLVQRSPFQDIHFELLMLQFPFVFFPRQFGFCMVFHDHVHLSVSQDRVSYTFVPINTHNYKKLFIFLLYLYMIGYYLNSI